jgi:3'(2'), 5'-bisphosphate nucleotidase
VVFGGIMQPKTNDLFYAIKDYGVTRIYNNLTSKISIPNNHKNEVIIIKGQGNLSNKLTKFLQNYPNYIIKEVSSSIKFCKQALGDAHIYPRFNNTMSWDIAAGQIIMEELGGALIDVTTQEKALYYHDRHLQSGFISIINANIIW